MSKSDALRTVAAIQHRADTTKPTVMDLARRIAEIRELAGQASQELGYHDKAVAELGIRATRANQGLLDAVFHLASIGEEAEVILRRLGRI